MLVTQAQFAKMKSVTAAAVSQWKKEGRLVLVDKKVDVAATEERLLKESSYHSKRIKPASAADVKFPELNVKAAVYADGSVYDNPANLPPGVTDVSVAIFDGAFDLGALLLKHGLPIVEVRYLVDAWIRQQVDGWVGGRPGLPDPACSEDWPEPPLGFEGWRQHPLFTDISLPDHEWEALLAEAGAP